jgi:trk system potassium uptake protein TrkH
MDEQPPHMVRRTRFETIHIVFNFLGSTFFVLTGILMLPLIVALVTGEIHNTHIIKAFLYPAALSAFLGVLCHFSFRGGTPDSLQAMLICGLGWIGFSALGALPFVIGLNVSYLDSYFEAMSGFTTTGITMFTGLDGMPYTILFWRSLTQWMGGIGILTFFLVVSYRGRGIHWLFGAETHKITVSRPVPGMLSTVKILLVIYMGFTFVIAAALFLAGMTPFDSICHSFTTLSTGGFSTHDASIGYYNIIHHSHAVLIEYIVICGMVLGGTNFLIHYRVLKKDIKSLWDNTEMKYWWGLICIFVVILLLERCVRAPPGTGNPDFWVNIEENIRGVLFQVVSVLTTTGFGTQDITSPFFGEGARQLFLVMMVIGGCVGSTGGGFKILRVAILSKVIRREIVRLRSPRRAVTMVVVDGKPVDMDEIQRVSGLFFMWIVLLICGGVITAFFSHIGGYESFSGMFSAVGNIGPSLVPVQMAALHPIIKISYIGGMLAGRLEILPVLLLFSPRAWHSKGVRR